MNWKDKFPKENRYFDKYSEGILYQANTFDILKKFPSESIDCVITSPPYWGARFYTNKANCIFGGDPNCHHVWKMKEIRLNFTEDNMAKDYLVYKTGVCSRCGAWQGQLGLEPDFYMFIDHLTQVFNEIKRILKPIGTCWINIADKWYGSHAGKTTGTVNYAASVGYKWQDKIDYSRKCLTMIPERFALKMIESGWILRNKIIWYKSTSAPESVKDRFTKSYEYIFFFTKSTEYYFNLIKTPFKESYLKRIQYKYNKGKADVQSSFNSNSQTQYAQKVLSGNADGANMKDIWSFAPSCIRDEHYASFPKELPALCIKAGCPPDGVVLDPFVGSGTTAIVAENLNRKWIGIEITDQYCEIAVKRLKTEAGQVCLEFIM